MKNKENPINALIIDDKIDYCNALAGNARNARILLQFATNLEDGIEILRKNNKIEFVILDGKCFQNSDSENSNITVDNIPHRAKELIENVNRDQNREIGYCVNTGYVDDLKSSFEGIFEVFDKDNSSENLFNYIIKIVSNSSTNKLKKQYNDCFTAFENGFIDKKYEYLLIEILQCLEKKDYKKKNFSSLRDFFEAILLGLINKAIIPTDFLNQHNKPNQEQCVLFLEGKKTSSENNLSLRNESNTFTIQYEIPRYISSSIRKLKEVLNENSHINENEILKFEFLSNTYLLLEMVNWFEKFFDKMELT